MTLTRRRGATVDGGFIIRRYATRSRMEPFQTGLERPAYRQMPLRGKYRSAANALGDRSAPCCDGRTAHSNLMPKLRLTYARITQLQHWRNRVSVCRLRTHDCRLTSPQNNSPPPGQSSRSRAWAASCGTGSSSSPAAEDRAAGSSETTAWLCDSAFRSGN